MGQEIPKGRGTKVPFRSTARNGTFGCKIGQYCLHIYWSIIVHDNGRPPTQLASGGRILPPLDAG
ncbi:hypothetical protein WBP07_29800 [Novosphingobium sp. BL-8A]|uniref:hypothetical protein n=1 Tax=Novosphingobium sp. BL-8A TaxID=3127639 RepID=UPI003756F0A6